VVTAGNGVLTSLAADPSLSTRRSSSSTAGVEAGRIESDSLAGCRVPVVLEDDVVSSGNAASAATLVTPPL